MEILSVDSSKNNDYTAKQIIRLSEASVIKQCDSLEIYKGDEKVYDSGVTIKGEIKL